MQIKNYDLFNYEALPVLFPKYVLLPTSFGISDKVMYLSIV